MVVETRTKLLNQALEKGKLLDVQTHQCVRQRKCITKKNRRASVPQIFQNYVVYSHALFTFVLERDTRGPLVWFAVG